MNQHVDMDGIALHPGLPGQEYGSEVHIDPPGAPMAVARWIYGKFKTEGGWTLKAWRGGWMIWRTTHWVELDTAQLRSHIYRLLRSATYDHEVRSNGVTTTEVRDWNPDKRKVANVIEAMAAIGHLSADIDPPSWIDLHSAAETSAGQVISCKNGLLDLSRATRAR